MIGQKVLFRLPLCTRDGFTQGLLGPGEKRPLFLACDSTASNDLKDKALWTMAEIAARSESFNSANRI